MENENKELSIRVTGISKRYRLGLINRQTLQDELKFWWYKVRGKDPAEKMKSVEDTSLYSNANKKKSNDFWALKDVSFEAVRGEVVGIIGRNGAGKSTLLKVLTQITEPTEGEADIHGHVSSLLEVGTGFHPELTGRENVYLNGTILGMKKTEVEAKFDEIVEFSEIGKFIDTPTKRYSSGMQVRLAFAVAAHLEPEVLLVDEVLAVGDAAFQKKCLGKMQDVAKLGRTILFVSHNMIAVRNLCDRVVWLENGKVRAIGETDQIVSDYLSDSTNTDTEREWAEDERPGNDLVKVRSVSVKACEGDTPKALMIDRELKVSVEYQNLREDTVLTVGFKLFNDSNSCVFSTTTAQERKWEGKCFQKGAYRSDCIIPANLLTNGTYRINLGFYRDGNVPILFVPEALAIEVNEPPQRDGVQHGRYPGIIRPQLEWQTEKV